MAKILIIEDDRTLGKVYQDVLTKNGYQVSLVEDASAALSILKTDGINLLLLDIMLPGTMNGFDLLAYIKRDEKLKSIPVIIMSNLDTEKQTGLDLGAIDYFVKANMDIPTLMDKIKVHVPSTNA
jgi:DNA-binding response OmpR family regulator